MQARDDPARHAQAALERERVADRHDVVAHLHRVGVAELDGREVGAVDLEHGQVTARRGRRAPWRVSFVPSEKSRLDLRRALDDVVVGDDDAVGSTRRSRCRRRRRCPGRRRRRWRRPRERRPSGSAAMSPVDSIRSEGRTITSWPAAPARARVVVVERPCTSRRRRARRPHAPTSAGHEHVTQRHARGGVGLRRGEGVGAGRRPAGLGGQPGRRGAATAGATGGSDRSLGGRGPPTVRWVRSGSAAVNASVAASVTLRSAARTVARREDRANRTRESFRGPRGASVGLSHQRRRRPRWFPSRARGVLFWRHEVCQATRGNQNPSPGR